MFGNGKSKLKQELAAADAVVAKFEKLQVAIQCEVTTTLAAAITQYRDAQAALSEAEVKRALGEASDDAIQVAEKRVTAAWAEIARVSTRLRGLRGGLARFGSELAQRYEALDKALPEHLETVRKDFAAEWSEAVRAFGVALGKRAALEAALGEPLRMLPEPTPVAGASYPAVKEPKSKLGAIKAALQVLGTWRSFDTGLDLRARPLPTLADGVYELQTAQDPFRIGDRVVEACFPPGRLRFLVGCGFAKPAAATSSTSQALWDAERKLQDIQEKKHQQYADDALRRDREKPEFEDRGYTPLYPQLSEEERKRRADPNDERYKPKELPREGHVITHPGDSRYQTPEPEQAPAEQQ